MWTGLSLFCVLLFSSSSARAQTKEEIQAICDLKSASPKWVGCEDCNDPCFGCAGVQCSDSHISTIKIIDGGIETLPESIGNLKHLIALTLEGNNFTSLPESIGQLSNLTYLWLSGNSIAALPTSFKNLKLLTSLWLDNNFLEELPSEFSQLENLIAVYLNGNKLTQIPESKYIGLKWLNLDWNSLDCAQMSQSANLPLFVKGKCNPKRQRSGFGSESYSSESEGEDGEEDTLKGPIIALVVLCISWVIGAVVIVVTCVKSRKKKALKNNLEDNLLGQSIN